MSIAVLVNTLLSCITAVVVPWLGVVFYYMLAVGQIPTLFPQAFGDSRSSLYISLATIVGLGVATATRQVNWARLFMMPNLLLMLFIVCLNIAFTYSPYAEFVEELKQSALSSTVILETINKIVLFYFVAILLIDTRFKLVCLITAIGGVLFYYTLWANKVYVTGEFWRFGDNGRLNGPFGVYHDENYFAMLFLLATPIFYYLSIGTSSRIIRYGLWFSIPFTWHALFLTGSRGALVSLAVVCGYIFFRSYSKLASIVLVAALVVAIVDQSGNMIARFQNTVDIETVERDRAFIENSEDSPEIAVEVLDPRILSWQVGLGIVRDNPIFGIGPGNFLRAYPDYHDSIPHVAHNTFVQVASAAGLAAGFIYLYFIYLRVRNIFSKPDPDVTYTRGFNRDYLDDLLNSLFIAFYCVAFFLDLMAYEILYFVFMLGAAKYCIDNKKKRSVRSLITSIYGWKKDAAAEGGVVPDQEPIYQDAGVGKTSIHDESPGHVYHQPDYQAPVHGRASIHQASIEQLSPEQASIHQPTDDQGPAEQSPDVEPSPNQYAGGSVYGRKQFAQ